MAILSMFRYCNPTVCLLDANFTYSLGSNGQVIFTSTSKDTTSTTVYSWNTGDGKGTGAASSLNYTYAYNGTYAVNLRISNSSLSCSSDTTIYVTITNATTCNLHATYPSIRSEWLD